MSHPKHRKCKALLALLGADPHEEVPTLQEAIESAVPDKTVELDYCDASGKQCFSSEGAARQAATNRMKKGAGTGKLRTYHCPDCKQFHLSSSFFR